MTTQRGMQRRDFIRLGLAGGAMLPSMVLGKRGPEVSLQWLQLNDDWAAPLIASGDWLAVEGGAGEFDGDGLYLYPAWGAPRPYLMRARLAGPGLPQQYQFCHPVTGRVLWTDSRAPQFAGRVCGRLPAQISHWLGHMPQLTPLQLPHLPA